MKNRPWLVILVLFSASFLSFDTSGKNYDRDGDDASDNDFPRISGQEGVAYDSVTASVGNSHLCLITNSGSVECVGDNIHGQIGFGGNSTGHVQVHGCIENSYSCPYLVGVNLPNNSVATSVTVGNDHSCALMVNGSVYCWGKGGTSMLGAITGTPNEIFHYSPVLIELEEPVTAIVAGRYFTCAITNDPNHQSNNGQILCWLGAGDNPLTTWEVEFTDGHGAVAVSASTTYVGYRDTYCAISRIGSVGCWGWGVSSPSSYGGLPELGSTTEINPMGGWGHECTSYGPDPDFQVNCGGLNDPHQWPAINCNDCLIDFRAFSISVGKEDTCALGQDRSVSPIEVNVNQDNTYGRPLRFICWENSGGLVRPYVWGSWYTYSIDDSGPAYTLVGSRSTISGNGAPNGCLFIADYHVPVKHCSLDSLSGLNSTTFLGGDLSANIACLIRDDYSLFCTQTIGNHYMYTNITDDFKVGNRDYDDDSILNVFDAFPLDDSEWDDTDFDGIGNNQDSDDDGDGFEDDSDVFPHDSSEWADIDGDGIGDNGDPDDDNDGHPDITDSFPLDSSEWTDFDEDGIGDNGDPDDDNDGFSDSEDAFQFNPAEWLDTDEDGIGNNADSDDDGDSWDDYNDAFPLNSCAAVDTDSDGLPDYLSGWGVACDTSLLDDDDDNDGFTDVDENVCGSLPLDASSTPEDFDFDGDGICDGYDDDDDDDGYLDSNDSFPLNSSEWADNDSDNIGDNSDTDDDNDGVVDSDDLCPKIISVEGYENWEFIWHSDESNDVDGDGCRDSDQDDDDDNDSIPDSNDNCPLGSMNWTSNQTSDFDGDGCRDADEDTDDDNDGFSDWQDTCPFDDSQWEGDCPNSEIISEDVSRGLLLVGGGALGGTLAVVIYVYISRKNTP